MERLLILCLCFLILAMSSSALELPEGLMEKLQEAQDRMKTPQHMFDRPKLDGVYNVGLTGDIYPYQGDLIALAAANGPNCRRLDQECGILYLPCCKRDPDTNEFINLMCQYPEGADVRKQYVTGNCTINPEASLFQELQIPGFQ